jgi:uncharacterized protein
VIFSVDSESKSGFRRFPNEEVARTAAENNDIMMAFGSIDPAKGAAGAKEARRLIRDFGIKGFKFHPSTQGFFPNDRMAYPLYEAIAESGGIALFHTGQTGVGSGRPRCGALPFLCSAVWTHSGRLTGLTSRAVSFDHLVGACEQ